MPHLFSQDRAHKHPQGALPLDAHELFTRACEAAAQGFYSEARQLLDRCLAEDPAHLPAHKELAFVLRMTGNMQEALAHRLEVKRLDPSDLGNRYHLANLYFLMGDRPHALEEAEALYSLDPANKHYFMLKTVISNVD